MDVSALMYGYRPITEADRRRKALAMRAGYQTIRDLGSSLTPADFVHRAKEAAGNRFGPTAQDSYSTTLMSAVCAFQPHVDAFLGAALNAITLSLSFQTRLAIDGRMEVPEVVLYEGTQDLFPVAMVHGNTIMGVHVTDQVDDAAWFPEWAADHPALEINKAAVFRAKPAEVAGRLTLHQRKRVGALMVVDPQPEWGDVSYHERYAAIREFVTPHTIYAFAAGAEVALNMASALQRRYPEARVDVRLYSRSVGAGIEYRGLVVFKGMADLPDIAIRAGISKPMYFLEAMPNDGSIHPDVTVIDYLQDGSEMIERRVAPDGTVKAIGRWEPAVVKAPFLLSSSAPIPEEGRRRISDRINILHSAGKLEGGMLIPSQDRDGAVYVCADETGRIVMEFGDEYRGLWNSPIWRNGHVDEHGVRRTSLDTDRVVRVEGAAMPLFFTPMLHLWYSHFVIQCLPRVQIARDLGDDIKILVPDQMRRKQFEMLAALGFDETKIVRMPAGAVVKTDRLYVPRAWQLVFTPYTTQIYRELSEKFGNLPIRTPSRILISRESRKTWRNMLNFEAVRRLLVDDYGFEVLAAEKLSLAEEIATFANAEIVVGAEGAGMYGGIFSRPGAVYLTLCDEDYVMPILGTLAQVNGIELGYVFGEAMRADSDLSRRLEFGHADFVVDLERVEAAVQTAIKKAEART